MMEKDNEMMKSKKKFPLSLIVCLAIVICALGAIGVKVLKVEDTNSGKETTKEIIVSDGDEIKVSDEETLRELLAKEETLSLVIKKDIYTSKPFAINGTKTLNGEGSIIMRLDAEAKKDLCVVSKGAELILDGATIDGNGVATGVHVQSGGKFKGLSGEILYGMPYGIQTAGVVEIEDITIDRAMHTALLVSTGGEAYMTGGKITNCIETGIAVAMKAYAKISGNAVLEGSAGSLAYNYGVLDITGGKLSGSTTNTIFNKSELNIISESDKLVEICDSKGSAISAVGGTTVNIDGLYIHDVAKHGLNLEKEGTGVVKNCTIERLGRMGLYVATSSVMEIENVTIKEGKYRGIVNNDGTVMVKNTDISDMEGAGIVTAGKKSVTTLEDIKIAKVAKSGLGITGGKVTAKNLNISDAAGSGINITTEASTSEITDAKVTKSGKNGIAMTIGTLTAKNIAIDGSKDNGVYLGQKAVVNLTDTTIKNSGIHAIGNYGSKLTTKKLIIDKTERGGIVSKGGTVVCDTVAISNTGSRAVNLLEDCKGTMTKLTVKDAGNTGVYVDGGSFKLTDYEINGVARQGLYFLNSEKIVAQNGTISNAKTNGIYVGENANVTFENTSVAKTGEQGFAVYRGTVTVRDLTIEETGKGGLISDGGTIKGNTVVINKTKSRAISLKNNATANIKILEIAEAGSVGAWVEDSVGNFTDFTIDSAKGTGVSVEGTGNSYLKNGVINALAKGVFVNTGATAEANNLKVYRMKGNAEPLIDVHTDAAFTLKDAESVVDGQGFTGRGMRVNGKVTMTGGTIKDNHFISEKKDGIGGGGVYIGATGNFIMNDGVIEKNTTSENGAGVYVRAGGNFEFIKGTVTNNKSDKAGAGIAVVGTLTMKNGKVEGNRTEGNAAGILVSKDATFKMSGGTISGNAAGKSGGGLFVQSDKATVSGGKIDGNTAKEKGIGVYVHSGTLEMTGGSVSNHGTKKAPVEYAGAGVYVREGASFVMNGENASVENNYSTEPGAGVAVAGTFNLKNGKIQGNNTTGNAAGIIVLSNATFDMTGGNVTGNTAGESGGGLFVQSVNATMSGGKIANNTASKNGSGVYVHSGTLTMTGGNIAEHGTEKKPTDIVGTGVYVKAGATFVMNGEEATVENNYSTKPGAGVAVAGTFNFENGTVQGNNTTGNAAGILVLPDATFAMSGGTVTGNTAGKGGGGLFVQSNKTSIAGGDIKGNMAAEAGSGVYVHSGTLTMTGGSISEHGTAEAKSDSQGAGVYVNTGATFEMNGEKAIVENNHSTKSGAGVAVYGTFNLKNGTIQENTTTGNAAGILVNKKGAFAMSGGTVSGNAATGNGGGIYIQSENDDKEFVTNVHDGIISGNEAANGAGIYVNTDKKVSLKNVTIQENTATENGGGIYVESSSDCVLEDESVIITTNKAVNGGGAYTNNLGKLTMKAGKITSNIATEFGSGVYVGAIKDDDRGIKKPFLMTGGVISDHGTATTPQDSVGTGVYVKNGSQFALQGGTVENNYSSNNGAGVAAAGTLSMSGGTIQNNITTVDGGGVYVLEDGTFNFNTTTSISGNQAANGGGVYTCGIFNLKKGTISGNAAASGAGVYVSNLSTFTMTTGTIQGNTATANGGGIYLGNDGSYVAQLNGGTIKLNQAANGGGLYMDSGAKNTMSGVTIQSNTATAIGGGVCVNRSSDFTVTNSTIQSNTAVNGGGVGTLSKGKFTMQADTYIKENDASENGSGVYVAANMGDKPFTMTGGEISIHGTKDTEEGRVDTQGTAVYVAEKGNGTHEPHFKLQGGSIQNNHTTANGAGIAVAGKLSMSGGTITNNTTTADGGGVYVLAGGAFTMNTTTSIFGNSAANGGGVFTNGTFTMKKGSVESNSATSNGGGVYVNAGTFEMNNDNATKKVSGNTAVTAGAGVYVNAGTFNMKRGEISGHGTKESPVATQGAGVYVNAGATFNMSGTEETTIIKNNHSSANRGTAVAVAGTFNMSGGSINSNTGKEGAGVYTIGSGVVNMTGGTISGNKVSGSGAGVSVDGTSKFILAGGNVSGNTAAASGGGIIVRSIRTETVEGTETKVPTFVMNGGTISGNCAQSTSTMAGGAIYQDENTMILINEGTISGNKTTGKNGCGGAIAMASGAELTIKDGDVTGNNSESNQAGAIYGAGSNKLNFTGNGTIQGNTSAKNVQAILLAQCTTSTQVDLNSSFTIGGEGYSDEIRFNNLSDRNTSNPILVINGTLEYELILGFHNANPEVYIKCDNSDVASSNMSNIKQNNTTTERVLTLERSNIKVNK